MSDKENNGLTPVKDATALQAYFESKQMDAIVTYMGNQDNARKFLIAVGGDVQRVPKLLECTPMNLITEYMKMAELGFYPSSVSGEAYVLPYAGKAQMQIGYKGIVTLLYGAGVESITDGIVRENDEIEIVNGQVFHKVDYKKSAVDRGAAIGAYIIATANNGKVMSKYMHRDDLLAHAKKFSKSYNSATSPWKEENDPELWMWKKTVLIQLAKLLPKNEKLNKAIAYDNDESIVSDYSKNKQKPVIDVTTVEDAALADALSVLETATTKEGLKALWKGLPRNMQTNLQVVTKLKELDPKLPSETK